MDDKENGANADNSNPAPLDLTPPVPGAVVVEITSDPETQTALHASAEMPVPAEPEPQQDDVDAAMEALGQTKLRLVLQRIETADELKELMEIARAVLSTYLQAAKTLDATLKIKGQEVKAELFYRYSQRDIFNTFPYFEVAAKRLKAQLLAQSTLLNEQNGLLEKNAATIEELEKSVKGVKEQIDAALAQQQLKHEGVVQALSTEYDKFYLPRGSRPYRLASTQVAGRFVVAEYFDKRTVLEYNYTEDPMKAESYTSIEEAETELRWLRRLYDEGGERKVRKGGEIVRTIYSNVNPWNYDVSAMVAITVRSSGLKG